MEKHYYLATTGNSEIWDLGSRILVLGPWCLTSDKCRKILKDNNIDYFTVSSPWKPAYKIKEADNYCNGLYEKFIPALSDNLNLIHNVDYPDKYWQVIIGPWLLHFINIFYDRYKRIESALKMFPDVYSSVLPEDQVQLKTYDTRQLIGDQVNDDLYNLGLFSIVLRKLAPGCLKEVNIPLEQGGVELKTVRYGIKEKVLNVILRIIAPGYKHDMVLLDMCHLPVFDKVHLMIKSGVSLTRLFNIDFKVGLNPVKDCSTVLRRRLNISSDRGGFEELLCQTIPKAIPIAYIENYQCYKKSISGLNDCKIIGSTVGWYCNEFFKYFTAEKIVSGAKLLDFQHGAVYGMAAAAPCETISLEKDVFYTWGWTISENSKAKRLPSPHMSRLKDTHSQKSKDLIFIGTIEYKYVVRFHTVAFPEDMPRYFEEKSVFLRNLSEIPRSHVVYKPFFNDLGWESEMDIVAKACPQIKLVNKGMAYKLMKEARLVVLDNPSTPLLEALSINVPTVLYWDHDVYLMKPEAEECFERLRKAGILYKDPVSAAKKVNQVFNDPKEWWLSEEVQDARAQFCDRFCFARKDWLRIWADEFKALKYKINETGGL